MFAVRVANEDNMITGIVYCIIAGCASVVTKGVFHHTVRYHFI